MTRRILTTLVAVLPLAGSLAYGQGMPLSGSYGFQATLWANDAADNSGAAVLGVLNFDGVGNLSGTYTLQLGATPANPQQTGSGNVTGTYTMNQDGTGSASLNFDVGFGLSLALVMTDGGQVIQFLATDGSNGASNLGGGAIPLRGPAQSLSGSLPASMFVTGAQGTIPLVASGAPNAGSGALIYTSTGGSSSGAVQCDNGSAGTWSATVVAFTAVVNLNPNPPAGGPNATGDYVLAVLVKSCGDSNGYVQTQSGSATGNLVPGGASNLILHGSGAVINGTARAGQVSSLQGAYGFRSDSSPVPAGLVGVMNFDGAGNVAFSFTQVGAPGNGPTLPVASAMRNGTYTINPDGTGTISLINPAGGAGATFSFVTTDGGAELLLLQTNASNSTSASFGTARKQ